MAEYSSNPLIMIQGEPVSLSFPPSENFQICGHRPEYVDAWCQIQTAACHFTDVNAARCAFDQEFISETSLRHHLFYVLNSEDNPVATAYLGINHSFEKPLEQISWLAALPEYQNSDAVRILISTLLERFYTTMQFDNICFSAFSNDLGSICLMQEFGFSPYLGPCSSRIHSSDQAFQEAQARWSEVEQNLNNSSYRFKFKPLTFRHSSMFSKCPFCKVFQLSAPSQSGVLLHSHDYVQIWYVCKGACDHFVEGQKCTMLSGDTFVLPPNMHHCTFLHEGSQIICCEFYMEALFPSDTDKYNQLCDLTRNLSFVLLFPEIHGTSHSKFSLSGRGQRQVDQLMHSMLEEYARGDEYFNDFLQLQIMQLLIILHREHNVSSAQETPAKAYEKYQGMVQNAIQYIDEHFDEPLTLKEVCQISMVSKTYFCYLFKLLTGKTFVEYLMSRRIDQSAELLRQTDLSITAISQSVGFHDSATFSRTFKRLKGLSPRDYRNAERK